MKFLLIFTVHSSALFFDQTVCDFKSNFVTLGLLVHSGKVLVFKLWLLLLKEKHPHQC